MEKRLKKYGVKEVREKQSSDKNISSVVLDLLKPLLDEADSIKLERKIIQMGIIAWNLGVIKTSIPEEVMDMLMEVVKRKCSKYKKYDQFIYDYKIKRIPGPNLHLTVAYKSANTNHQ